MFKNASPFTSKLTFTSTIFVILYKFLLANANVVPQLKPKPAVQPEEEPQPVRAKPHIVPHRMTLPSLPTGSVDSDDSFGRELNLTASSELRHGEHRGACKRSKRELNRLKECLNEDKHENWNMVNPYEMGGRPPPGKTERRKRKTMEMTQSFIILNKREVTPLMKHEFERDKILRIKRELDSTGNEERLRKRNNIDDHKKKAFRSWMGKVVPEHAPLIEKMHSKEVEQLMQKKVHGMEKTYADLFYHEHPQLVDNGLHKDHHAEQNQHEKHDRRFESTEHLRHLDHLVHGEHLGHAENLEHQEHLKHAEQTEHERKSHGHDIEFEHKVENEEKSPRKILLEEHYLREDMPHDIKNEHPHNKELEHEEVAQQTQPPQAQTQAQTQQQQQYQQQLYQQQMYQQQQQQQNQYNNYNNYGGGAGGGMNGMGMNGMGMNGMGMNGMGMNGIGMNGMGMNGMGMNGMGMGQMGGVGAIINAIGNNLPKLSQQQQQPAQPQTNQQYPQQNYNQNYPQMSPGPHDPNAPDPNIQNAQDAAAAQEKAAQDQEAQVQQPDTQDSAGIQDQQDTDASQDDSSARPVADGSDDDIKADHSTDDIKGVQPSDDLQLPSEDTLTNQLDNEQSPQLENMQLGQVDNGANSLPLAAAAAAG